MDICSTITQTASNVLVLHPKRIPTSQMVFPGSGSNVTQNKINSALCSQLHKTGAII